ncbi:MAG TPA: type 2 isopentenyl-diphosphate Delta-isomerase [Syntrophomonadaceae bacterium]|nr:type 2 isopentenyl-diphosphate Delta-isomerase [Syntrophomonadaceae bacterium]
MRNQRKTEHLDLAVQTPDGPLDNGFGDLRFVHDSIPELNLEDIDLSVEFLGKRLSCPLVINALTGGNAMSESINRDLAWIAARHGLGMAVGSQTAALDDPSCINSFAVARKINPEGLLLANLGAGNTWQETVKVVEMIGADAVQLHFNVPQELAMAEGDRHFRGVLHQVREVVEKAGVPVIAKEVGFGFSRESAARLYAVGVCIIDIGGSGGTNFIRIEDRRNGTFCEELDTWGIPTAVSLAEVLSLGLPLTVIATGGIRTALEMAKALAMGASLCGAAGWFLGILREEGINELDKQVGQLIYRLKAILLMTGSRNWGELQKKPLLILGRTADWLRARNIDPNYWARRRD